MLTRVTVVVSMVRLATPSLTWHPYLYPRAGVEGFRSFPRTINQRPTDGPLSLLAPAPGRPSSLPAFAGRPALGAVASDQRGGPSFCELMKRQGARKVTPRFR